MVLLDGAVLQRASLPTEAKAEGGSAGGGEPCAHSAQGLEVRVGGQGQ